LAEVLEQEIHLVLGIPMPVSLTKQISYLVDEAVCCL